jgi:predicted extracellular nuclease
MNINLNNMKNIFFICAVFAAWNSNLLAQQTGSIVFYNVENLFDTIDCDTTFDEEYTPAGKRAWNGYKYYQKLKNTYKVLANAGGVSGADIIALCEIENRKVLEDLVNKTPLQKHNYTIVHKESPDFRGIDVAFLIKSETIEVLKYEAIPVAFIFDTSKTTRDILYAKLLFNNDTLHAFVNHWPSRRGGQEASQPKRVAAATVLRAKCDSILNNDSSAHIVITGDFNDTPSNYAVNQVLAAQEAWDTINPLAMYNLSYQFAEKKQGTHKYKGHWSVLDQFIVSGNMLTAAGLSTSKSDVSIFSAEFLLEEDERYTGFYPKRTFRGLSWNGGYSDHLPIVLNFRSQ